MGFGVWLKGRVLVGARVRAHNSKWCQCQPKCPENEKFQINVSFCCGDKGENTGDVQLVLKRTQRVQSTTHG